MSSTPSARTGVFIDSAVAGIRYDTSPSGFSGNTNAKGEYQYVEGDTLIFSVGSLKFPAVTAKAIVTPLDIAGSNDPQNRIALNIAALLQSLDTDGDPDNGISINYDLAAAHASAVNFDLAHETFAALPAVVNLTANSGSSTKALVSQTQALAHMQSSLTKIDTAPFIGTWYFSGSNPPPGGNIFPGNDFHHVLFILNSSHYAQLFFDKDGKAIFQHGTYSWNRTSTELKFEGDHFLNDNDPADHETWLTQLSNDGSTMTRSNGWGNIVVLSKLTSATNPLVGGWGGIAGSDMVVLAFTDTHYFHGQSGSGNSGAEYGTYSNTSGFTVNTLADSNGQSGFSHPCNIVDTHLGELPNDYSCMGDGVKDSLTATGDILDFYSAANVIANETNAPPRNNEPEHYYFNRIMKNDHEVFGSPNPLTGSWILNGDTFIFSGNNTFTHVKAYGDDPYCGTGIATGMYKWDDATSALNVTLFLDPTGGTESSTCSIGGLSKLTLNGNTFVLAIEDEFFTFTKSTSSTGLAGTWVGSYDEGYTALLFTDTQYFLSDYHYDQGYGTESGTYSFNSGTSELIPSVVQDDNGDAGFSNGNNQTWTLIFTEDGNRFTIGDGFQFKRLK